MTRNIVISIQLLFFSLIICCCIYPLSLLIIGQMIFPFQANGSLVKNANGTIIGSSLIAQNFTQDEYFHPRPSAANYDAGASASSALAASNPKLRERVAAAIKIELNNNNNNNKVGDVPSDLVTTSASGLDPHITLQSAIFQLDRISTKWASILNRNPVDVRNEIQDILKNHSFAPLMGLAGVELVNVLEINLILKKKYQGV